MKVRGTQIWGQVLITAVMVAFLGLVGRLFYINAKQGTSLLARAEKQQKSVIPIHARRGLIVDTRGRILAGTLLRRSVFADPSILPDKEAAAQEMERILGIDAGELGQDLMAAGQKRFHVIRRGLSEEQADRLKDVGIYGLGVFDEPYRTYPTNQLAAAVLGFVAPDGLGVSGLEHQYDEWLRGENGVKTIIRDAGRKAFWLAEGGYHPPRDGLHIVLTLDSEIQANVERELADAVNRYRAESGVAIVMHAKTGAILAMANAPGFDPNRYGDYSPDRYRNRAITDPYEPGSTFKVFVAAGALAEGVVHFGQRIDCEGGLWKDGPRLLHDHHPYGTLTFEEVFTKSSNIGMGKIGKAMGNRLLMDYVTRFGFGQRTGVGLAGESPGIVRPFEKWDGYTTTSVPMGHEISVTPLQMTRAFCVFANGGLAVTPYIIRAALAADGRVVQDYTPSPPGERVLDERTANLVKDRLLCAVVNNGTGAKAALSSYQVFGKTGTAQIPKKGGRGYERNAYVSSFIGGAPGRDPQLVVYVAIRKPERSRGYYGGAVAAPVVREILAHALAYLQIPPERRALDVSASASLPPTD